MSAALAERLNQVLPLITERAFLSGEGIGNEIACYIFDYPPEDELEIRGHINMMMKRFASHHGDLRVTHLDLLDVCLEYLKERGILDKAVEMQATKDDATVLRALRGPLAALDQCKCRAKIH